jgi:hypothetical protein
MTVHLDVLWAAMGASFCFGIIVGMAVLGAIRQWRDSKIAELRRRGP